MQSELRSTPLLKLNSSFHQERKKERKTVTGAAEKLYESNETRDQLDQKRFLKLKLKEDFLDETKGQTRIYFYKEEKMSAGMKKMILLPFLCIMLSYMVSQKDTENDFILLLFSLWL